MKLFFLFVALSCLVHSVASYGSGISSTVFSLANYQTENGGFSTQVMEGAPGSLDDTAHALFLSSFFGVKDKIDVDAAINFLATLQNSDGGFSNQPGQNSDLESVWNALVSYIHLGSMHHDTSKLLSFVHSLYDNNAKLFRNTAGSTPDFKATARALQIFQLLELNDKEVASKKAEIADRLKASIKESDKGQSFSSITSDNYFGILVANLTGLELEDADEWISYFRDRQVLTGSQAGGFYSDEYATEVDVSDADHAIHAIYLLTKAKVTRASINTNALTGFLNSLPPALATASHAYAALGRTTAIQEIFKVAPSYAVQNNKFKVVGNRVIQGTLFRPNAFFRTSYGQPHGGATGSVVITHGNQDVTQTFTYNTGSQTYESQEFYDSSNQFGELVLTYTFTWSVPGFDELSFTQTDRKSIGFDISVDSKAVSASDEYDPHESVDIPTTFTFVVNLGTVSVPKPELISGDFDVVFTVLDSSNVIVHTDSRDARKNRDSISFTYELSSASVPAGRLTFRFQVKTDKGVHTTEEVWYNVRVTMVATDIDFEQKQTLNFGHNVKVSMQPATYFGNAVETYEKVGSRRVFLDVHTPKHSHLASYPGSFQTNKYVFEVPIAARLDFIGTHVLTFRYQDALGNDFPLQNYNSEEGALFEEDLSYTVEGALEASGLDDAPEPGTLNFGDEISFSFTVKDSWTDSVVLRGGADSTVFLALRHTDNQGNSFYSSKIRAVPERDPVTGNNQFTINWEVDPNALKGSAKLVLFALDADGNEYPIKYQGQDWSVDVTVDGALQIDHKAYSKQFDDFDTVFIVAFDLSSAGSKLTGAELTARIVHKSTVIGELPVVASPDGAYQVSWSLPNEKATSGDYVVDIYRKVDKEREQSPFFFVTVNHQGRAVSPLPFKTEFLALLVLGVALVSVSVQKTVIEKKN